MSESEENNSRQNQENKEQEKKEEQQKEESSLSVRASSPQENLDNQQTTQLDDNQELSPDQNDEHEIDPEDVKKRLNDSMSKNQNQEEEDIENEDAVLFTAEMIKLLLQKKDKKNELMEKGGEHGAEKSRSNDFKNNLKSQLKDMEKNGELTKEDREILKPFYNSSLKKGTSASEEFEQSFLPKYQQLKEKGNLSPESEAKLDKTVRQEYAKHAAHYIQQRAKLITEQFRQKYGSDFSDRNKDLNKDFGKKQLKEDERKALEDLDNFANGNLSQSIESDNPEGNLAALQQQFEEKLNNVENNVNMDSELREQVDEQKQIFQDMHKYNQQRLKSIVPESPKPGNDQQRQPPSQKPNDQVNGITAGQYQPNTMGSNQLTSQTEEVLRVTNNDMNIPQGQAGQVDFSGPNNPGQVYYIQPVQDSPGEFSIKKHGGAEKVDDENLINAVKSMPGDTEVTSINQELQDQHNFASKAKNKGISINPNVEKQINEKDQEQKESEDKNNRTPN